MRGITSSSAPGDAGLEPRLAWPSDRAAGHRAQPVVGTLGVAITVLAGGLIAALLSVWNARDGAGDKREQPLFTSAGTAASWDPAVAFSLSRMHSYLSLGVPSELVREHVAWALARQQAGDGPRAVPGSPSR